MKSEGVMAEYRWQVYKVHHELGMAKQRLAHFVARHLPKYLLYWAVIVVWAKVTTTGEWSSMSSLGIPVEDALRRWEKIMSEGEAN